MAKATKAKPKELPPAMKRFEDALQGLSYMQTPWNVFTDFLDYSLIMLDWVNLTEERFDDLKKKYPKPEQHKLFAEAYFAMADIAEGNGIDVDGLGLTGKGFKDPFGDYYMEHFSNDHAGQFFTPEHLCDFMAALNFSDAEVDEDKVETVCDPCCGSGRMLLSAAKKNRNLKFYAADIDLVCVKMTLINFMLNSMQGEVVHMDTLSNEMWKAYKIFRVPHGDHLVPCYMEIHVDQSAMRSYTRFHAKEKETKPPPVFKEQTAGKAVQISLF